MAAVERLGARALELVLLGGIAINFAELYTKAPGELLETGDFRPYFAGVTLSAALAIGLLLVGGRLRMGGWMVLLGVHFFLGRWMIHEAAPNPGIDVVTWQREAIQSLQSGINPYGTSHPNFSPAAVYGSGMVVDGRVQIGLPYPPLSLLLATASQALAGDYRFGLLGAMLVTTLVIALARPSRIATAAALMFLSLPRSLLMLEGGWTEPFCLLLLAITVCCAIRAPRWTPVALGLLVAVKQYLFLALPLSLLLPRPPQGHRGQFGRALLVAAVITVPFVLWSPGGFWRDVVAMQLQQPFRRDALSFPAIIARLGGPILPSAIGFVGLAVLAMVGMVRLPRSPAGFAAALGGSLCGFFAFNKQAFANYYYFVIGALLLAVGTAGDEARSQVR